MNFWDKTLDYRFYDLNYESLTTHQEQETKRLIEYLELDLDEACLAPQKNKRNIRTASQLQIRKKVYKGSSDVWRKFRPHLNGVFDEFTKI